MEMVVAIFVVSVMTAVTLPHLMGISTQADKVACRENEQAIQSAITEYYLLNHSVPTGTTSEQLQELVTDGLLESVPTDPGGGEYTIDDSDPQHIKVDCSVHGSLEASQTP